MFGSGSHRENLWPLVPYAKARRGGACFLQSWSITSAFKKKKKYKDANHLGGGPVVRAWNQEICFLCGLRFELCGCLYDGHWRFTWSLTSRPVGLVEVRASWPGYPR